MQASGIDKHYTYANVLIWSPRTSNWMCCNDFVGFNLAWSICVHSHLSPHFVSWFAFNCLFRFLIVLTNSFLEGVEVWCDTLLSSNLDDLSDADGVSCHASLWSRKSFSWSTLSSTGSSCISSWSTLSSGGGSRCTWCSSTSISRLLARSSNYT